MRINPKNGRLTLVVPIDVKKKLIRLAKQGRRSSGMTVAHLIESAYQRDYGMEPGPVVTAESPKTEQEKAATPIPKPQELKEALAKRTGGQRGKGEQRKP